MTSPRSSFDRSAIPHDDLVVVPTLSAIPDFATVGEVIAVSVDAGRSFTLVEQQKDGTWTFRE